LEARTENLELLYRWVRYRNRFSLSDELRRNGINTVAIYGGGNNGVLLYEELAHTPTEVKYIIDRSPELNFPYPAEVYTPQRIDDELARAVDAVIVTVDYYNVRRSLASHFTCPLLSLHGLIIDIDAYDLFSQTIDHAAAAAATLLLLDCTQPLHGITNPSHFELFAKSTLTIYDWMKLQGNHEFLWQYYNDISDCSAQYINEVYCSPEHIEQNGVYYCCDKRSRYLNVFNHCRITADVPETYDSSIHFFGNCLAAGFFTEDQYTIESYLQRKLNSEPVSAKNWRVVNHGGGGALMGGGGYVSALKRVLLTSFQEKDYIVLLVPELETFCFPFYFNAANVHYYDLAPIFSRPHEFEKFEIFFDTLHTNHRGYKLLADRIYTILAELDCRQTNRALEDFHMKTGAAAQNLRKRKKKSPVKIDMSLSNELAVELKDYLNFLHTQKVSGYSRIGAIVMNCNPFTLGHRWLVERSLGLCEYLYIFVVEEDKSEFKFPDRLQMIKSGLADLPDLTVLPSGAGIISAITFPAYFSKDKKQTKIDPLLDINIFGRYIAPALGITVRFSGSEPRDYVTRQYIQAMAEVLPGYGVEFMVFERKTADGEIISAQKVRQLRADRRYDEMARYVPLSTLDYLRGMDKGREV
jgi:[citrate (pro-3S)-lyase] ligase